MGGTGVLMQGGLHPDLKIDWFERLLRGIKQRFPSIWLHCFSASEILAIAEYSELSVRDTIRACATPASIPSPAAARKFSTTKSAIASRASNAARRIGCCPSHRASARHAHDRHHDVRCRTKLSSSASTISTSSASLQEETGGFTAFIPWSFQPKNTALGGRGWDEATAVDYLKVLAISRLYLDNIENVQSSWVTQGPQGAAAGPALRRQRRRLRHAGRKCRPRRRHLATAPRKKSCAASSATPASSPCQRDTLYRTMFLN